MNEIERNIVPWNISAAKRYAAFIKGKESGKKCALYVYEAADDSTFRYRAYNVMRYTEESERWCAQYFFANTEKDEILQLLPKCELLVLVRVRWTHFVEEMTTRAHILGKTVLFDADDLVFDLDYLNLVMNTLCIDLRTSVNSDANYDSWFSYVSRIGLSASRADGLITTNSYLGRKFTEKFGKPYGVIKNSLGPEQLTVSEEYVKTKKKRNNFLIGYFSGSPSHINDFLQIAPEMKDFLDKHPDAKLQVVGYMELPEFFEPLIRQGRVLSHPFVDFLELQNLIANVDVNIVPLLINDFTNCKSELKYFEAAIVDTVTIATPIYTYSHAITNGENGFLCNVGEWFDTLERVYNKDVDIERINKSAHEHALSVYAGKAMQQEIENCFDFFFQKQEEK